MLVTAVGMMLPKIGRAQLSNEFAGMQLVLEQLYEQMLPLCGQLIGIGQGLAGFGALWYIAARVWKHLAAAEPIDFYPLLRPFGVATFE